MNRRNLLVLMPALVVSTTIPALAQPKRLMYEYTYDRKIKEYVKTREYFMYYPTIIND